MTGRPHILCLTGASGAGKTTLVRALDRRRLDGVGCYEFDAVGVPSADEMTVRHGSPEAWQRATLDDWVRRLAANPDGVRVAVLDGQARPTDIRATLDRHGADGSVVLADCDYDERHRRLAKDRDQPELVTADMDRWAAYLRGQADALGLTVLDTGGRSLEAATDALAAEVRACVG